MKSASIMLTQTTSTAVNVRSASKPIGTKRLESIDLLRGLVMVIMALDHARDYFHASAFVYNPEDLAHTNVFLFFTRFITHYCAPVFVFLAGISAYLYGTKKTRKELVFFLLTRGVWLILIELFILSFFKTFNITYPFFQLQVIWAIGISMIVLAAAIYAGRTFILIAGILLIAGHNLLDKIHVPGNGLDSFLWAVLHDPTRFTFGNTAVLVHYPLLPWIGIMLIGYYAGQLYSQGFDAKKRKSILLSIGLASIMLFIILRAGNFYGEAAHWSTQKNVAFSLLSFLNVTKYPPSLLYILVTLGPALIFLALAEKPLNALTAKIVVFGRVPMFYYLSHFLLLHILATIAAAISGYHWYDMILSTRVNASPQLKGYGFSLAVVYAVWIGVVLFLYPLCKWFAQYKKDHQSEKWWLSYI